MCIIFIGYQKMKKNKKEMVKRYWSYCQQICKGLQWSLYRITYTEKDFNIHNVMSNVRRLKNTAIPSSMQHEMLQFVLKIGDKLKVFFNLLTIDMMLSVLKAFSVKWLL